MNKIFFFFLLLSLTVFSNTEVVSAQFDVVSFTQDKTILIKKIKAKINALQNKRKRLIALKKWSNKQDTIYLEKMNNYTLSLEKLGEKSAKKYTNEQLIRKLQKELKYINNARVNKNAKDSWTIKDDSIYEKKAGKLIDSIIKLRMKKS
ncbi:MAG: hypothetical protein AB8B78_07065 [Polaribacter sp.]